MFWSTSVVTGPATWDAAPASFLQPEFLQLIKNFLRQCLDGQMGMIMVGSKVFREFDLQEQDDWQLVYIIGF